MAEKRDERKVENTAFILDGGQETNLPTEQAVNTLEEMLRDMGWSTTTQRVRDLELAPCLGCFACWVKTPGVCIIDDAGRDVARAVRQSRLVALVTPVTFGGYSSTLKNAVDRLIPLIMPYFTFIGSEVHHLRRYETYPSILGVGLLPGSEPEQEQIFQRVIHRNSINMHSPEAETCFLYEGETNSRQVIGNALAEVTS